MGKEAARTHLSLMHPGNLLEAVHCRPSMVRIIRIISCWHRVAICPTIIIASRFRRLYPQTDAIPSIFSPIFPAMRKEKHEIRSVMCRAPKQCQHACKRRQWTHPNRTKREVGNSTLYKNMSDSASLENSRQ